MSIEEKKHALLRRHAQQAFASFAIVLTIAGIIFAFKGNVRISLSWWILLLMVYVLHYIIHWPHDDDGSMLETLINSVLFIPKNIFILLFKNISGSRKIDDIHKNSLFLPDAKKMLYDISNVTKSMQQTELFAEIAGIKETRPKLYYIVYTHINKGEGEHRYVDLKGYKITGFPIDETETIMRVWYFIVNYLKLDWNECRLTCSCGDVLKGDEYRRAVQSSLSIIGSVKGNKLTELLMSNILELHKERGKTIFPYLMGIMDDSETKDEVCYLMAQENHNEDLYPTPLHKNKEKRPKENERLIDYAFISKLPNILSKNDDGKVDVDYGNSILFIAGCKTAGQIEAMRYLFKTTNMIEMIKKYKNNYFYELIKVEWNYVEGGLPRILSNKVLSNSIIEI